MSIDHGAAYSRTAKLNYQIDYHDNLAFPFPANFICRDIGSAPDQACKNTQLSNNDACSVPLGGMKKDTYFNCDEDLSSYDGGDVPVTLCVVSADASIPDNPSSSNQAQPANKANLSDMACDSITLDRTAPALSLDATATSVYVGDLVSLTAQASDATSGLTGTYAWRSRHLPPTPLPPSKKKTARRARDAVSNSRCGEDDQGHVRRREEGARSAGRGCRAADRGRERAGRRSRRGRCRMRLSRSVNFSVR